MAAALAVIALTGCSDKKEKTTVAEPPKKVVPIDRALYNRLDAFAKERRPNGKFGFYVYDLTADKPVYGCNEHMAQPSASCLKLLLVVQAIDKSEALLGGIVGTADIDGGISDAADLHGVGHQTHGRGVDKNVVVLLTQHGKDVIETLAGNEFGGVGGYGTGHEQVEVVVDA